MAVLEKECSDFYNKTFTNHGPGHSNHLKKAISKMKGWTIARHVHLSLHVCKIASRSAEQFLRKMHDRLEFFFFIEKRV